jgi:hypothetical protein
MEEIRETLRRLEEKVDRLLSVDSERRDAKARRRQHYQEAKAMREKGRIRLPEFHVLCKRDGRLESKRPAWVSEGMRFGAANDPAGFVAWLVYQWNSCTYLKKPVTFSGGYYRVHTGQIRYSYGASDLMGLNEKQAIRLRTDADHVDFQERPWWKWSLNVLYPVWSGMEGQPGFDALPVFFCRGVRLLLGGFGEYEVYTGLCWDPAETLPDVNRMLKRVAADLRLMWKGCRRGLRVHVCPATPAAEAPPGAPS